MVGSRSEDRERRRQLSIKEIGNESGGRLCIVPGDSEGQGGSFSMLHVSEYRGLMVVATDMIDLNVIGCHVKRVFLSEIWGMICCPLMLEGSRSQLMKCVSSKGLNIGPKPHVCWWRLQVGTQAALLEDAVATSIRRPLIKPLMSSNQADTRVQPVQSVPQGSLPKQKD